MLKNLIYLFLLFILSACPGSSTNKDPAVNELTNNGRTLPTSNRVTGFLNRVLSGPKKQCVERNKNDSVKEKEPVSDNQSKMKGDLKSGNGECEVAGTNSKWRKNCKKLLRSGKVPNGAFKFALQTLKKNASSFKTDKCFASGMRSSGHYSMKGLTASKFKKKLKKGIPNKCQIKINNLDERYLTHPKQGFKCQMASYYVDICTGKVKKSKTYVGYGTCKRGRGFKNATGQGTTLVGAFLTGDHHFNFQKRDAHYKPIAKRLKRKFGKGGKNGFIPATPLMGLQRTNSRSSKDLKYMHVAPYTSAGCPSIPEADADQIVKMTINGPSLVVNYKSGKMENINRCSK